MDVRGKVHLVHKAGLNDFSAQQLVHRLTKVGYEVVVLSAQDAQLGDDCDMIVAAGGDGTVEKVLRRFYGQHTGRAIPLAIIPMGTANNIARSFGVNDIPTETDLINYPDRGTTRKYQMLSVGKIFSQTCERYFAESVGCGLLAHIIAEANREPKKHAPQFQKRQEHLQYRRQAVLAALENCEPADYQLRVDDCDISGNYLLVEIMNIPCAGPGLELAPDKDPGNNQLEVVFVDRDEKARLQHYLCASWRDESPVNPFRRVAGTAIELRCRNAAIHIDDKSLLADSEQGFFIQAGRFQVPIAR